MSFMEKEKGSALNLVTEACRKEDGWRGER